MTKRFPEIITKRHRISPVPQKSDGYISRLDCVANNIAITFMQMDILDEARGQILIL